MPRSSLRPAPIVTERGVDPAYERDLHAWSQAQARALRTGRVEELDLENLAEEIDDLGRSQRGELRSRTRTLVEHLLKLEGSSCAEPRRSWRETVRRTRLEIGDLLSTSPSLRRELPAILDEVGPSTGRFTAELLGELDEDTAIVEARLRAGG